MSYSTLGLIGTCLSILRLDSQTAERVYTGPHGGLLLWLCAAPIECMLLFPVLKRQWQLSKSAKFSKGVDKIVQAVEDRKNVSVNEILWIGQSGKLPGVNFRYVYDWPEEGRL